MDIILMFYIILTIFKGIKNFFLKFYTFPLYRYISPALECETLTQRP